MRDIVLICHNIRSSHNVGSLLRTADGLGISRVYLTGYTPYPRTQSDARLPHIATKVHKDISKTALGAETKDFWSINPDISTVINDLRTKSYTINAIEQTTSATPLPDFAPSEKTALIVGREVEGIEEAVLDMCDRHLEIPMFGSKESFNVSVAAGMALYHCRFR